MFRNLELTSAFAQTMPTSTEFRDWFRPIVESTGIKHKVIAKEAGIKPESFSRILGGSQGVKTDTARALARAINNLTGREAANEEIAVELAVGITRSLTPHLGPPRNMEELIRLATQLGWVDEITFATKKPLSEFTQEDFEDVWERLKRTFTNEMDLVSR